MRRTSFSARIFLAASLVAAVMASPASADQAACRNLEAQLASVSNGGDRTKLRRYDRAIINQRQQLERAQNRLANNGCAGLFSTLKPHCGEMRSTVNKMESNLRQLERTKNQLAGGNAAAERSRIMSALSKNGCRGAQASGSDESRPTTLFSRLFGNREEGRVQPKSELGSAPGERSARPRQSSPSGGRYRTLCVRTCDGYFFPIAYASSRQNFDRDQKACQAMCPGTEVELYYHNVPEEEADAMVSAQTDVPYADLPAAFRYREAGYVRSKSCQCNPPKDFSIIAGDPRDPEAAERAARQQSVAVLPAPQSRPDPAEDPEARDNREGGLTASALADLLAPKIAVAEPVVEDDPEWEADTDRQVRVVGPTFLPDPEAAIDLRAPGRTELR